MNSNTPPWDVLDEEDTIKLINQVWGPGHELIDCKISHFSAEKLGLLAVHLSIVLTVRNINTTEMKTEYFFMKARPEDSIITLVEDLEVFDREIMAYSDIFPQLKQDFIGNFWAPILHLVTKKGLIFENLRERNYSLSNKIFSKDEMFAVMATIAQMHAASIIAEKRLGRPLDEIFSYLKPKYFGEGAYFQKFLDSGIDLGVAIAKKKGLDSEKLKKICSHAMEGVVPSKTKQNVLCHADLWPNNIMFNKDSPPKCILVDFQICRYGPLVHDLFFVMHQCSNVTFRKKYENALLKHYYFNLCEVMKINDKADYIPPWTELSQDTNKEKLSIVIFAMLYAPITGLQGEKSAELFKDADYTVNFLSNDRVEEVLDMMEKNESYAERVVETVNEVIEVGTKIALR